VKNLIHGNTYTIRLFYTNLEVKTTYLVSYQTLFGEEYNHVFLAEDGRLFEISEVDSWRKEIN